MDKVKGVFSKIGSAVKSHVKVVIIAVVVIIVAILLLTFIGGSEKRAIKKHLSALNSYNDDKIIKTMDLEAAVAYNSVEYDDDGNKKLDEFEDALDDVEESSTEKIEDNIKDDADEQKEYKGKIKLLDVVYVATAKDNKDLKKVYVKYKVTAKATDDEKDDAKDDEVWDGVKANNSSVTGYGTFILYKNKVISSPFVSTSTYSYDN